MNYKDYFKEGKEIILSTASKDGIPNANIVVSLGFTDSKLLVANCQMNITNKNLEENPNICVIGGYFRIKGNIEILSSGKYFDMCVEKSNNYDVKSAILINIVEIFDLDKSEKIEK